MKKYLYSLATDQKNDFIAKIIKIFLYIFSLIYGFCIGLILFFYKISIFHKHKLPCKVISVGNITWGGTGKTPFLVELATYLKSQGHNLAIVSRGYKSYKNIGDEAYFLKNNLTNIPIIAGSNRLKNAKIVIKNYKLDTIILDDGFQHWRIFRDLDIVLIDATNPFGNKNLIPRGILREPLTNLKRADIFVLTKIDLPPHQHIDVGIYHPRQNLWCGGLPNHIIELKKKLITINPQAPILESRHSVIGLYNLENKILDLDILKNKNAASLCAIGNPSSFIKTLENLGANIILKFSFLDHHEYKIKEIKEVINKCKKNNINTIITTQKDAVKLKDLNLNNLNLEILVLKIKLEIIENKERLYDELCSLYTY